MFSWVCILNIFFIFIRTGLHVFGFTPAPVNRGVRKKHSLSCDWSFASFIDFIGWYWSQGNPIVWYMPLSYSDSHKKIRIKTKKLNKFKVYQFIRMEARQQHANERISAICRSLHFFIVIGTKLKWQLIIFLL